MQFELLRSDGHRLLCSPSENSEYFSATISGLGLTGLITWVELRLKKISSSNLAMENIKFSCLDEFFSLSEESDGVYEYTMSWVDCVASGDKLGRGHFSRANHIKGSSIEPNTKKIKFKMPVTPPISFINSFNLRMLNALYYNRQLQKVVSKVGPYEPFFFPLDSILEWNRIYGPKGFLQYQCIVPKESSKDVMREILEIISKSGMGSSLAIMKVCGDVKSPGLMSFPMSGTTLSLDFPYVENKTLPLFAILDDLVIQVGGRLYPAKDAHMNAKLFKAFYPNWETLQQYKDPKFSSSMWKRVMEED